MDKIQLVVNQGQAFRLTEFFIETKTGFSLHPDGSNRWVAEPECASLTDALRLGMALREMRIEPENLNIQPIKEIIREKKTQPRTPRKIQENNGLHEETAVALDLSQPLPSPEAPLENKFPENGQNEGLLFGIQGQDNGLN